MAERRCVQDGKLVILPERPQEDRPTARRRNPRTMQEIMADIAADERLAARFEAQKASPTDVIPIEVRRKGSDELVGIKPGERRKQSRASFRVSDPDMSQLVRANREVGSTRESIHWSLTAQVKGFPVEIVIDEPTGRASQVVRANDADLWTIVRDAGFRRAGTFTPKSIRDLTHRDLDALISVRTHGKVRPEFAVSDEMAGLFAAGLIANSNVPRKPLALTDLGRSWLADRERL